VPVQALGATAPRQTAAGCLVPAQSPGSRGVHPSSELSDPEPELLPLPLPEDPDVLPLPLSLRLRLPARPPNAASPPPPAPNPSPPWPRLLCPGAAPTPGGRHMTSMYRSIFARSMDLRNSCSEARSAEGQTDGTRRSRSETTSRRQRGYIDVRERYHAGHTETRQGEEGDMYGDAAK